MKLPLGNSVDLFQKRPENGLAPWEAAYDNFKWITWGSVIPTSRADALTDTVQLIIALLEHEEEAPS